jgi:hypothetical protein
LGPRLLNLDVSRNSFSGQLDRKQLLDDVFLLSMNHLLEHVKTFFLVFLKRVLLPITA